MELSAVSIHTIPPKAGLMAYRAHLKTGVLGLKLIIDTA